MERKSEDFLNKSAGFLELNLPGYAIIIIEFINNHYGE